MVEYSRLAHQSQKL